MNRNTESLPARVKVVCPQCGRNITTGQSGNSTRCPISRGGCGATVYVPAGQTRPPVTLLCRHCQSLWDTRAAAGNMVRCPSCRAPRRVPAAIRQEPTYAPAPERYRTPERRPRQPAAPRSAPAPAPAPTYRRPAPAIPAGPTVASILRGLMRPPALPTTRPAATPRPAAPAPTYRPAPPIGRGGSTPGRITPAPPDTFQDHHRRDSAGQLVTSMGALLRLAYDTPHGMCEVMDVSQPRDRQRCRGVASRGVVFWSQLSHEVTAYACPAHAVALAAETAAHPAITATVVGLNI